MNINLTINSTQHVLETTPSETLFTALRRLGYYGIKFGDEQGLTGADTVLLDGRPVNAGSLLAAQAEGHNIVTIEGLGEHPDQGWKKTEGLHPLQQAFIETGAIQCGYCTPAQILAAKALLDKNPHPTEAEIREAIAGVLCRCTGYPKPVQAILRAAAVMRGESPLGTKLKSLRVLMSAYQEQKACYRRRLANQNQKWTPSNWPRANLPLPPISKCATCCMPKSCTRRTPMPASKD